MSKTKDLIIGCVDGYEYKDIAPWLNSIKASGFDGDVALIVYNMSKETGYELTKNGVTYIFAFNKNEAGDMTYAKTEHFNICVERFAHMWHFLREMENQFRYVIVTDVKDVVFQKNPSVWLERLDKFMLVGTENLRYEDEPWSRNNMKVAFGPGIFEMMRTKPIYCAGVIAGTQKQLSDLFMNIYLLCRGCPSNVAGGGGPDQSALNILISLSAYSPVEKLTTLDAFVFHAGTSREAIMAGSGAIGESYLRDPGVLAIYDNTLVNAGAIWKNGQVCTPFEDPYCIVHQYDRVPEWKAAILKRFGVK